MALYFECQINKKTLLQTFFWRFCPLGRNCLVFLMSYCNKASVLLNHNGYFQKSHDNVTARIPRYSKHPMIKVNICIDLFRLRMSF